MHNRPEAALRLIIRACIALFTGVVIVLFQSVFWTSAVSGSMRAIVLVTALVAYFRPHSGLLALAVLTPLGQVGSRTLDSNMRGAEALVLAFLAGALLRGWTLHRFRSLRPDVLSIAGVVFSGVVAVSLVEQLWFLQLRRDAPTPFLLEVATYATRRYLIAFDRVDMIFSALLLLEGVALLIYVAHYCRTRREFAHQLIASLVLGAVAAAAVNVTYVGFHLAENGPTVATMRAMRMTRWSFHVGDVNAAASFFAMAMFIAVGMSSRATTRRGWWIAAAVLTAVAFWLAGSRTGLIAVLLAAAVLAAKSAMGRSLRVSVSTAVAITVAALVTGGVLVAQFFPAAFVDATASQAVRIRWLFLGTTWRMLLAQPLFGVGVGQYARWSSHFSAPEMANYYASENAHNYFAQVAGELGLLGLITFVWLLAVALRTRPGRSGALPHPALGPVAAGLAVFILTWLGGHPLLVPEVSYPFWLALGVVPGVSAATPHESQAASGT